MFQSLSFALGVRKLSLPLCPATARALEQALWNPAQATRAESLLGIMRLDPGLVLFFSCLFLPEENQTAPSLTSLAKSSANGLAASLQTSLIEAFPADATNQGEQFAHRAAIGVLHAEWTHQTGVEQSGSTPDSLHWAALALSGAQLLQDGPAFTADHDRLAAIEAILPWLPELAGLSPESFSPPPVLPEPLPTELLDLQSQVLQHWRAADESAYSDLRRIVQRLAPLETLQHRFDEQLETEKLLAMKELAYGAGHEINNPLANISVRAQTLLKQEQDPERRRMLSAINGQVYRAHEMIADLMLFAQPPKLKPEPTDLVALLQRLAGELRTEAEQRGTELTFAATAEPMLALVDPVQTALAIQALVINAWEAIGRGGRVELLVRSRRAAGGRIWAEVLVKDDGPGISDEVRHHLFDPFYSGREAGRGLGFGLSKCWRIVTAHGGQIDVNSAPGHGAEFTLRFPVSNGLE